MLSSPSRLKHPRDISRVFKRGRYSSNHSISMKAAFSGLDHSRAVIVVSKKVSKKATQRNRTRRRVSGELEKLWQTVMPGYDIVITVRSDLEEQSSTQIADTLKRLLDGARLVPPK